MIAMPCKSNERAKQRCVCVLQKPGWRIVCHGHGQPSPKSAQHSTLCPKPGQATALQHSRSIRAQSLAAEEASAVAEGSGSGVSEQERAQFERWAQEVAVRSLSVWRAQVYQVSPLAAFLVRMHSTPGVAGHAVQEIHGEICMLLRSMRPSSLYEDIAVRACKGVRAPESHLQAAEEFAQRAATDAEAAEDEDPPLQVRGSPELAKSWHQQTSFFPESKFGPAAL